MKEKNNNQKEKNCEDKNDFQRLQSALQILSELEDNIDEQNDEYRQIKYTKDVLSTACNNVGTMGGNQKIERAVGRIAGIAIRCGHDNLAQNALEIGGELHE